MEESSGWCTIESDPGVFTELVERIGVTGIEFQEIFSLDESSLSALGDVLGLIFLFKYNDRAAQPRTVVPVSPEGLFFARQVIQNACATQAILSVLLNTPSDLVELGPTLTELRSFTEGLDDESKGLAIGNSDVIRVAHNSFRPNVSLEVSYDDDKRKGEAFHFISYVWVNGTVYELDGLQDGPVSVGSCSDRSGWLTTVAPFIQSRIAEYTSSGDDEIRFNLMALVRDRRPALREQLLALVEKGDPLAADIQATLDDMEHRRAVWRQENVRRRHDFVPLALRCLEMLAREGKLTHLLEEAQDRQ